MGREMTLDKISKFHVLWGTCARFTVCESNGTLVESPEYKVSLQRAVTAARLCDLYKMGYVGR